VLAEAHLVARDFWVDFKLCGYCLPASTIRHKRKDFALSFGELREKLGGKKRILASDAGTFGVFSPGLLLAAGPHCWSSLLEDAGVGCAVAMQIQSAPPDPQSQRVAQMIF
jgi:hypothetical protein